MKIKFAKMHPVAQIPMYMHVDDAGMDVTSVEDVTIPAGRWEAVRTGLAVELPFTCEAQVRPRSGLALKYGVTVLNAPGTIDAGYRGEIKVVLYNASRSDYTVHAGDRIAQLVIARVERPSIEVVVSLGDSKRGNSGFGSTGGLKGARP